MSLINLLHECISRGQEMTQAIAIAQFGDDSPEARRITRRWGITEVADLIGVSPQAIRDAEKNGRLPPPDFELRGRVERRAGYTIDQISHMRSIFGNPNQRPADKNPAVLAVMSHKGGVYKTSSAVHEAQWLALQGHRVLLIEGNDPQGTASMYHGYVPDLHIHAEDTLLPFYLGERDNAEYAIKPTCWPGLDIIPSCLALHRIETDLMQYHAQGKLPHPPHLMLRAAIESVWDNYDIIVIDSAPNLGTGTINVVCAADIIVVATPAELFDYSSVLQFFTMLLDLLKTVDLGGFEPVVRLLLTKYSLTTGNQSRWMEEQIRNTWGSMVLRQVVRVTDEVGKGQIKMR
ncbi:plasmid-partitioning protein SopA, partial [Klebsiella pneumoniae]|nr:plasmid-partitioning protein SopA [Klebsiella pneumoniae]